ncbi:hypothetical protein ACFL3F_03180, partial [Planctomycetota bacterium]
MDIYEQLQKKSLLLLEAYETDLMHDKDWIESNPGVSFMHYTRATGTHLIPLNPSNTYPPAGTKVKYLFGMADREYILQGKLEMQDWFENAMREPPRLILHYDGRTLQPVTLQKAREILGDYAHATRS